MFAALPVVLFILASSAFAQIHRHVDPETGAIILSNLAPKGERQKPPKSRARSDTPVAARRHEPMTARPREPVAARRHEPAPARRHEAVLARRHEPLPAPETLRPSAGQPGGFPIVPAGLQRHRDSERLQILLDELNTERQALQRAVARGASSQQLHRYRENIGALEREIANARR